MIVQVNRNWTAMNDYSDELSSSPKVSFDTTNPNDDIWRKFSLPLTPPSSPSRSFGETSVCNDNMKDVVYRLQDVCDSLDSAFYIQCRADPSNLKSKLISDCMWSGNHIEVQITNIASIPSSPDKKAIDVEEDLYPTPCASPLPIETTTTDYPSSNECVNPITVFPLQPQETLSILSGQSDTDEEIDVVTVDTSVASSATIHIGSKRKLKHSSKTNSSSKIRNSTIPPLERTKSAPAKLVSTIAEKEKERLPRKYSIPDESDPEMRRTTHNVLERKRRIDLKNSFERLRECVPNLEKIEKTPKVIVLKKAADFIADLNEESFRLEEEKQLLLVEKAHLTRRLDELVKQDCELIL